MKRLLFIVPFLLIFSSTNAQLFKVFGHDIGFIYVGPKVGMNLAQLTNWVEGAGVENKYKYGYQLGIVGEFGITSRFSFNTELTFMSRGMQQEGDAFTSKIKVNYIGIPLLMKYSFNVLGLKKVYFMGGTYQDVKTGGESIYESPTFTDTQPLSSTGWTKADWGMALGAGAEYPTDYGIFGLDLRYSMGFVDVHKSDAVKNRNRNFGISLTYKYDLVDLFFKLKKKKSTDEVQTVEGENKVNGLKVE